MTRALSLALATLLALPALAAEPAKKDAPAQKAPAQKAPAGPRPGDPKADVVMAKRSFRTAVQLCDVPGRCDPGAKGEYATMLEGSEAHFVEVCERCSTPEKCESERRRIRDGKRSPGAAPCE